MAGLFFYVEVCFILNTFVLKACLNTKIVKKKTKNINPEAPNLLT